MAVGLQVRVPILDHRVVEFAWQIPRSMKIRNGQGKWLLRQVLHRYVPEHLVERPKSGFGIPIGDWLRGPLRSWAEALLDKRRLLEEGFFNPDPIREKWAEHLTGRKNRQYHLWDVLMFQAWHEEYQPTIRHSDELTVLCRAELYSRTSRRSPRRNIISCAVRIGICSRGASKFMRFHHRAPTSTISLSETTSCRIRCLSLGRSRRFRIASPYGGSFESSGKSNHTSRT